MRERHYGTMILWYCEIILPLLWYDSMRPDTLNMWPCFAFLFAFDQCVFSYCPASFSSFVFKSLSLCFLF